MINFETRDYRSAQTRPSIAAPAPQRRVVEMAETMREILYRDGNVTEQALIGEGFTAAEIIEYQAEARAWLHGALAEPRNGADILTDIAAKALAARAWDIPQPNGGTEPAPDAVRRAWAAYVAAQAAHRLDPWVSQSERVIHRLKAFLDLLPIAERSRNRVITQIAADLKRRIA